MSCWAKVLLSLMDKDKWEERVDACLLVCCWLHSCCYVGSRKARKCKGGEDTTDANCLGLSPENKRKGAEKKGPMVYLFHIEFGQQQKHRREDAVDANHLVIWHAKLWKIKKRKPGHWLFLHSANLFALKWSREAEEHLFLQHVVLTWTTTKEKQRRGNFVCSFIQSAYQNQKRSTEAEGTPDHLGCQSFGIPICDKRKKEDRENWEMPIVCLVSMMISQTKKEEAARRGKLGCWWFLCLANCFASKRSREAEEHLFLQHVILTQMTTKPKPKEKQCQQFLCSFIGQVGLPKPKKEHRSRGDAWSFGMLIICLTCQSVTKKPKKRGQGKLANANHLLGWHDNWSNKQKRRSWKKGEARILTVPSFGKLVCKNKKGPEKQRSVHVSFQL